MQYLDHRGLNLVLLFQLMLFVLVTVVVALATSVIAAVIDVSMHCVQQVTANRVRARRVAQMKRLNQHQTAM